MECRLQYNRDVSIPSSHLPRDRHTVRRRANERLRLQLQCTVAIAVSAARTAAAKHNTAASLKPTRFLIVVGQPNPSDRGRISRKRQVLWQAAPVPGLRAAAARHQLPLLAAVLRGLTTGLARVQLAAWEGHNALDPQHRQQGHRLHLVVHHEQRMIASWQHAVVSPQNRWGAGTLPSKRPARLHFCACWVVVPAAGSMDASAARRGRCRGAVPSLLTLQPSAHTQCNRQPQLPDFFT